MPIAQAFLAKHRNAKIDLRLHDGFIDLAELGSMWPCALASCRIAVWWHTAIHQHQNFSASNDDTRNEARQGPPLMVSAWPFRYALQARE
ncbi:hypothetical protein CS8_037300 [Cupriavidus sp. 8B]